MVQFRPWAPPLSYRIDFGRLFEILSHSLKKWDTAIDLFLLADVWKTARTKPDLIPGYWREENRAPMFRPLPAKGALWPKTNWTNKHPRIGF